MTNKKVTRRALLMSVTSLLICISMLLGTTFGWFTDEVTSGVNKIVAGNLDVELQHSTDGTNFSNVTATTTDLFKTATSGILWEPGAMAIETFKVINKGSLALKYQFALNKLTNDDYNTVTWANNTADTHDLREVIKVAVTETRPGTREAAAALTYVSWDEFVSGAAFTGHLDTTNAEKEFTVVLYWKDNANAVDNKLNLKNGVYNAVSNQNGYTLNNPTTNSGATQLYLNASVTLLATQYTVENDSFDNMYDDNATGPNGSNIGLSLVGSKTETYSHDQNTALNVGTNPTDNTKAAVTTTVAANTTLKYTDSNNAEQTVNDSSSLKLTVEETDTPANFTVTSAANETTSFEVTLETVTNSGNFKVSSTDKAIITDLYIGVVELAQFAHNGTAMTKVASKNDVDADGEYFYDVNTGYITMATKTFSPFTAEYKYDGGLGDEDHPYKIASVQTWKKFVDACAADSSYAVTNGKYFDVTTDIDASAYTERMNIKYFAGHIDFNNHELSGYNASNSVPSDISDDGLVAVFSNIKGNVEISNLKFTTSGVGSGSNIYTAVSVAGVSNFNAVDVTFKNVDTYGTVTGATGNNNSLLLAYVYMASCKVTCIDCDNYATIIGSGYRSAFVGNIGYASCKYAEVDPTQVTFTNCHNYGTIISTGNKASMLMSNSGYPKQDITVTITNCSNEGAIISKNPSDLKVNNIDGTASNYHFTGDVTGNPVQTLTTTVLGTSNGNFVLTATEGAKRYELNFSFTARSHAGGNVGYVIPIEASGTLPPDIFVGEWLTKEEADATGDDVVNHGTYYTCGDNYVFYEDGARFEYGRQVLATFIAYGENNEMLSIATYTYPYVNN